MDLFRIVLPWGAAAGCRRITRVKEKGDDKDRGAHSLALLAGMWAFISSGDHPKVPEPPRSIAVMPFENYELTMRTPNIWLDGMTETLISSLSQLPELNVKGRVPRFVPKRKGTDASQIAGELNAQGNP